MLSSVVNFFGGVFSAFVVKLLSSIDDVLWLSAFLIPSRPDRLKNSLIYLNICLVQTAFAFIISTFGEEVLDPLLSFTDMSTERCLTLLSGSMLFLYSLYLTREYYRDENDGEDHGNLSTNNTITSPIYYTEDSRDNCNEDKEKSSIYRIGDFLDNCNEDKEVSSIPQEVFPLEVHAADSLFNDETGSKHHSSQSTSLIVIAFLGSLDDLTLFVPLLAGRTFGIVQLVIGATIAILLILILCLCLTRCQFVTNVLEKIPLAAIVFLFSILLLLKGILLSS